MGQLSGSFLDFVFAFLASLQTSIQIWKVCLADETWDTRELAVLLG